MRKIPLFVFVLLLGYSLRISLAAPASADSTTEDEDEDSSESSTVDEIEKTTTEEDEEKRRFKGVGRMVEEESTDDPEDAVISFNRDLQFISKDELCAGKGAKKCFKQPFLLKFNMKPDAKSPPFSYHGFYSPAQWHLIPPSFFMPDSSITLFSNEKAGFSFMRFKLLKNRQSHCTDDNPAPIDIITKNAEEESSFTDFSFHNYATKYKFDMFIPEDGTDLLVVKFKDEDKEMPTVSKGSIIGRELTLDSIFIRYGSKNKAGSEHYIDGQQKGMELQFIFKSSSDADRKSYWSLADSVNEKINENGTDNDPNIEKSYLVLCVLVEVKDKSVDVTDAENNEGLIYLSQAAMKFWDSINERKYRGFQSVDAVLSLQQFFKFPMTGHYYTYSGTMSFPPCLPFFRYSVFEKPVVTDYKTWQKFDFIKSEFSDTGFLAGNFRPLNRIYINKTKFDEYGVPMGYQLHHYLKFKEQISKTVKKSRLLSERDKQDDYDYYEEESSEFRHRVRKLRERRRKLLSGASFNTPPSYYVAFIIILSTVL